jgi:uncharacterized membrane-anchored protein
LFWAAFVLTRPLGAVVGDLLDKPLSAGGLDLSRFGASAVLLAFIVACVVFIPQRPATARHCSDVLYHAAEIGMCAGSPATRSSQALTAG